MGEELDSTVLAPTRCYFEELCRVDETMSIMMRYDRSLAARYEL